MQRVHRLTEIPKISKFEFSGCFKPKFTFNHLQKFSHENIFIGYCFKNYIENRSKSCEQGLHRSHETFRPIQRVNLGSRRMDIGLTLNRGLSIFMVVLVS